MITAIPITLDPVALLPFRDELAVFGLRRRHWLSLAVVVAFGHVVVSVAAVAGLWGSATRTPTTAELERAAAAEVTQRWRSWPAGRIFPQQIAYSADGARRPGTGHTEFARRIGIAPVALDCAAAVDVTTARIMRAHGCRAVLRATYLDQLQGIVVTIAVAAFPDEWSAYRARLGIPGSSTTLHAVSFAGTVSARFTDAARQDGTAERAGPYIVLTTSGHADGRPAAATPKRRVETFDVAPELGSSVADTVSTPSMPDCTSREWKC